MQFEVRITRTERRKYTFHVEAENISAACEAALEEAYNHDFRYGEVISKDDKVTSVTEEGE